MNTVIKIGVIGGDSRGLSAAYRLMSEGFRVECFGVPKKKGKYSDLKYSANLEECVTGARAVLLGVPYSCDNRQINCSNDEVSISVKQLLSAMTPGQLLLGGRLNDSLYSMAREHGVEAIDYFEVESLSVENAIPTAEGGCAIAMRELDVTLHGSRSLVIGYGRVGKVMAKTLAALGSRVTVTARRSSVKAWCEVEGYDFIPLSNMAKQRYDVIFNTVPRLLIDSAMLEEMDPETLIIDLASMPGGVDMAAARRLDRRVIRALSLPGKVAFDTAGRIIKDTVIEILEGEGII